MVDNHFEHPILGTPGELVIVKNDMSASVLPPPEGYSSRLAVWEEATGCHSPLCAHEICNRQATHGAIARRAFTRDRKRYIFPACETCARRTEMLYVRAPLVALDQ